MICVESDEPALEPLRLRAGVINRGLSIEALAVLVHVHAMPVLGEPATIEALAERMEMPYAWIIRQLAELYAKQLLRGTPPAMVAVELREMRAVRESFEGRR